jgi:hypothetical protein
VTPCCCPQQAAFRQLWQPPSRERKPHPWVQIPGSKPPIPNTASLRAGRQKIGPNPGLATATICSFVRWGCQCSLLPRYRGLRPSPPEARQGTLEGPMSHLASDLNRERSLVRDGHQRTFGEPLRSRLDRSVRLRGLQIRAFADAFRAAQIERYLYHSGARLAFRRPPLRLSEFSAALDLCS